MGNLTLKMLSHNLIFNYVPAFDERNDIDGQVNHSQKTAKIAVRDDTGLVKPLSGIFVVTLHELFHHVDDATGHELFTDKDKETSEQRELALSAFCELLAHIMMENNLINPTFMKKLKNAMDKVG